MEIISIDLGGTSVKSAIVTAKENEFVNTYKLQDFSQTPTNAYLGKDAIIENIFNTIKLLSNKTATNVVSISSAGTIDWDTGRVIYATDALPNFTNLELAKIISQETGKQVRVINDAVCALIGEAYYNDNAKKDTLMLTLGTGLGSAIVRNIKTLNNKSIENLQIAHIPLVNDGEKCMCGKFGCAEQYVSATGLKRDLIYISENTISNKDLTKNFFANFVNLLDIIKKDYQPVKIIIGGGIIELKDYWWHGFLDYQKERKQDIYLTPARLGNTAGILGSVYATLNGEFK